MGMLEKAKNAAKSTKLKGEIALLDRDMRVKKQKFGIELSDLLWDIEAKQKALGGGGKGSKYLISLQEKWDVAKVGIQSIRQEMEEIQSKLAAAKIEQVNRAANQQNDDLKPSAMDKAKAAGTQGKRMTKLQLLEVQLKGRKQQFGIDVYEFAADLVSSNSAAASGGDTMTDSKNQTSAKVTNAVDSTQKLSFIEKKIAKAAISQVSAQLNKLTVSDKDIEKCICTSKTEVEAIQAKKDEKLAKIESLKQQ